MRGKGHTVFPMAFRQWDHPRLCGEKVPAVQTELPDNRITPAYAGKSGVSHGFQTVCWDHPRLCGEK